jgi:carbonic anhydrase
MATPMNISNVSMGGTCDERCSYSYNYDISTTCIASNYNTYISLSYDRGPTSPVIFNNVKYNVSNIEIYSPSIHDFNNKLADAEIIIVHTSAESGALFLVCIPCSTSGNGTNDLVNTIFADIISKPLSHGEAPMTVSIPNYNLNNIIPKKPFYYYISQTGNMNVVVYDIPNGITVNANTLNNLKSLISQATMQIKPSIDNYLFYNKIGPTKLNKGNGSTNNDGLIYIDCSPTGNSYDTTSVDFKKPSTFPNNDISNYFTTENIIIFLCFLFFLLVLIYMNQFFVMIGKTGTKKS